MRCTHHGRPPSNWLRSLSADEPCIWLKAIEAPEADVRRIALWNHLTRDHSSKPERIAGLTVDE
jgi:hypothetical protein